MNRYDYLTRDIQCLVLRYKDDQYEFHRALSMLLLCFCKNNNEASLTETRNGVLHFRFITESRIETNLTIDRMKKSTKNYMYFFLLNSLTIAF